MTAQFIFSEVAEVPFADVVKGRLEGMSRPILVAAPNDRAVRRFMRAYRLQASEVLRLRSWVHFPNAAEMRNKVLLLLPGWSKDGETDDAVEMWVRAEGYTCVVPERPMTGEISPRVPQMRLRGYGLFIVVAFALLVLELTGTNGPGWAGWLFGLVGFAVAMWEASEE